MGNQPSSLKFAVIGHQDEWSKITRFVNTMRGPDKRALSENQIKEIYTFFPPCKLFDVRITSPVSGTVEGFYVETFISPDQLTPAYLWKNIGKVKAACEKAVALGAQVVSLGGFTSIILEATKENFTQIGNTVFTTGNSLTAAFVAEAVEKAVEQNHNSLSEMSLLVVGSTGDIGSACVNYFAGKVKHLLLTARQVTPLREQEAILKGRGLHCMSSTSAEDLLPMADIVICVASSMLPAKLLRLLPEHAIVCDAGYPKNLERKGHRHWIFDGGMGVIKDRIQFFPEGYESLLPAAGSKIFHGCLLEAVVLAMENKAVPFSSGKGNINREKMKEIMDMANRHEISAALFQTHKVTQT